MKKLISVLIVVMMLVSSLAYCMPVEFAREFIGKKVSVYADLGIFGEKTVVGKLFAITKENIAGTMTNIAYIEERDTLEIKTYAVKYITIIREVSY